MDARSSEHSDSEKTYIAIDLKSFYASVECVERGLDPLNTCLVVADRSRTEKTICLAVSPALKSYGIPGRPRLFEVIERVKQVNADRLRLSTLPGFNGCSASKPELDRNPDFSLGFYTAPPRMAHYMRMSTRIYEIYLRYLSPEDIHIYSVDEIFADVSSYLHIYHKTAHELAMEMIRDVLKETGITATCGIGTNLYLAKVAMDIVAKHMPADKDGVRIAELDEYSYREQLWTHKKLTDFWRIGRGYQKKLASVGLYTMGDIARCSLGSERDFYNEELLYRLFGINAELLIDHAWGYEPTRISDIKAFKPETNSLSTGQVLSCPYSISKAKTIIMEMADSLVFDLMEKRLETDQIVLSMDYDVESLSDPERKKAYRGSIVYDHYGRPVPKPAHGSGNLGSYTASNRLILKAVSELFDRIAHPSLLIRRMYLVANHVKSVSEKNRPACSQLDLFTDYSRLLAEENEKKQKNKKEHELQRAMLSIKNKYGKNAVLRGINFREGATMRERNQQIGGHKA